MDSAALYRFYVPDLRTQLAGSAIHLPADQAHHARAVLRLEPGKRVFLFDGNGGWAPAVLTEVTKKEVCARLEGALQTDLRPEGGLTLATAVPKGERAEWLVEQASQLNVAAVQWLAADRGVVKPKEGGQKIEKWRRLAVESAKQCGRTHVLEIHEPCMLETLLQSAGRPRMVLWLDPRPGGVSVLEALMSGAGGEVLALVGPEGGWSPREWDLLEAEVLAGRVKRVKLTPTILRIETACAAIAAIVGGAHCGAQA